MIMRGGGQNPMTKVARCREPGAGRSRARSAGPGQATAGGPKCLHSTEKFAPASASEAPH
jgi:hypothetical protein